MKPFIGVYYNVTNDKLNTYAVYDVNLSHYEVIKLETMHSHISNKKSFPLKYFSTQDLAWKNYIERLKRMKQKLEAEIEGKRNTLHGVKMQLEKLVASDDVGLNRFFEEKFIGKEIDSGDHCNVLNGQFCDTCGTQLIDRCTVCGAPVCCPKCCDESLK